MSFPENPSARQIANADQRIAAVSAVVDRLVQTPPPSSGDRAADVVQLGYGPVIDAMIEISEPGDEEPALTMLAAELLYRLLAAHRAGQSS